MHSCQIDCFSYNKLQIQVTYKAIKNTYLRINSAGVICISTSRSSSMSYLKTILEQNYTKLSQRVAMIQSSTPLVSTPNLAQIINSQSVIAQLLIDLFPQFAKLGYHLPRLSIKKMRTRWGSYSAKTHRIHLNQILLYLDIKFSRYVIIHELCHLIEMNHSPQFYALMDFYQPDWRTLKLELNKFAYLLT